MTPSGTRTLMLVDDEPAQQRLTAALAARGGWRTVIAADAEIAIATLGTRDGMMLDAVLLDQYVPDGEMIGLIAELRSRRPALPILILTANNSVDGAVGAMRAGASDFLVKPIAPEHLLAALDAGSNSKVPQRELRPMTEKMPSPLGFGEIVGSDPDFRAALAIAAKAARSRVPLLIEGESGVGKELVATAIHSASPREKRAMTIVNCAATPSNMIESELFGHEKGAFTGAFSRHIGKAQHADGGTLFLDEIGALPHEAQIKLLRLLESGEVHPIGARGFREVDVRVITATNDALIKEVEAGRFREDLYYKLATVHITLPPLRKRQNDMPALARHMLARIATQPGLRGLGLTDDALALLSNYDWPGNVRQLQTTLFRAAVMCEGDALTASDFPEVDSQSRTRALARPSTERAASEAGVTLYQQDGHLRALEAIEADVIRLAIGHYRGRMTEVARRLGIGRSTLYRKLAELGISEAA